LHLRLRLLRSYLQVYTIGAAVIEMMLDGQLRFNEKEELEPTGLPSNGEAGKEQILQIIISAPKKKKMKSWMHYFINRRGLRERVFNALIAPLIPEGMVRQENYKILFFFPAKRYYVSATAKDGIIQRLRAELLEAGPVSVPTAALGMLLEASKVLKHFFSEYEQGQLKQKLGQLQAEQSDNWKAVLQIKRAILEMEAANNFAAVAASSAGV
jgi:hypothetical protein